MSLPTGESNLRLMKADRRISLEDSHNMRAFQDTGSSINRTTPGFANINLSQTDTIIIHRHNFQRGENDQLDHLSSKGSEEGADNSEYQRIGTSKMEGGGSLSHDVSKQSAVSSPFVTVV